jgi:hypothetical protein
MPEAANIRFFNIGFFIAVPAAKRLYEKKAVFSMIAGNAVYKDE